MLKDKKIGVNKKSQTLAMVNEYSKNQKRDELGEIFTKLGARVSVISCNMVILMSTLESKFIFFKDKLYFIQYQYVSISICLSRMDCIYSESGNSCPLSFRNNLRIKKY